MTKKLWLSVGFLPLVIAPAAIIASCSGDTTTTAQTESGKEVARLNEVIKSNKLKIKDGIIFDEAKLTELKNAPDKLLTDYLDKTELNLDETKFTYNIDSLSGVDQPKQAAAQSKTMNFKIKVTNKQTTTESALTEPATVPYQFQPSTPTEQTPLEKEVAKVEAAHAAGTFKLKDNKKTITQDEINKLTANPATFLTDYTDGLALATGFTAAVKTGNFSVTDKAPGSKQQQAGKQQTITFKVTVNETATKMDKDTKDLTFDFTLQAAQPPTQQQETQTKASVSITDLGLNGNKDTIKPLVVPNLILSKKAAIFQQGFDLITAEADIPANSIGWEELNPEVAHSVVLKFKVAAQKWYQQDGNKGTQEKEFRITLTNIATT